MTKSKLYWVTVYREQLRASWGVSMTYFMSSVMAQALVREAGAPSIGDQTERSL